MKFRAKDVAKALNISASTVSLVVNGKSNVSPATRQRVLEYIQKKGFEPDSVVKGTAARNKNIIFVFYRKHQGIVSQSPFFMDIVGGIERETHRLGYQLNIKYFTEQEDVLEDTYSEILAAVPMGVIVLGTDIDVESALYLKTLPYPMLILNTAFPHEMINCVAIDNMDGAYRATQYLIAHGHRKIGYIKSRIVINNFLEREKGFKSALSDAGIEFQEEYEYSVPPTNESAYKEMKRLLTERSQLPTAFFGDNDKIVFGATRALKEAGLQIPRDVSLVGFDDTDWSTISEPKLTTVRVHASQMGIVAVRQIDQIIEHPDEEQVTKTLLTPELVERESVSEYRPNCVCSFESEPF